MEKEVVTKIATGLTYQGAADSLCLSDRTIQFHMGNAMRKLGARNSMQAVNKARELGEVA